MMKQYHLYVFTQESCPPCGRLKEFVSHLSEDEQSEIDFVPLKTFEGRRTALAEELNVELTPTLVVTHVDLMCELDKNDEEFCDQVENSVERYVGANSIIKALPSLIDAYTYAHPE